MFLVITQLFDLFPCYVDEFVFIGVLTVMPANTAPLNIVFHPPIICSPNGHRSHRSNSPSRARTRTPQSSFITHPRYQHLSNPPLPSTPPPPSVVLRRIRPALPQRSSAARHDHRGAGRRAARLLRPSLRPRHGVAATVRPPGRLRRTVLFVPDGQSGGIGDLEGHVREGSV